MIFSYSIEIINGMFPQWNIDVSEITTMQTLMIFIVCIEIINVLSMLHRRRIVVSLINRPIFSDDEIDDPTMLAMYSRLGYQTFHRGNDKNLFLMTFLHVRDFQDEVNTKHFRISNSPKHCIPHHAVLRHTVLAL